MNAVIVKNITPIIDLYTYCFFLFESNLLSRRTIIINLKDFNSKFSFLKMYVETILLYYFMYIAKVRFTFIKHNF